MISSLIALSDGFSYFSAHWFSGNACSIDGFYDDFVDAVLKAEKILQSSGHDLTLSAIVREGNLSESAFNARLATVEIPESVYEKAPCCYVKRN